MTAPLTDAAVVEQATAALRAVLDPELALDVVALGLIYAIVVDDGRVVVDMTLTTPGCPVSEQLPAEARAAVAAALPGCPVDVRIVWDPPWTPDRMTTERGLPGRQLSVRSRRRGSARR